jgi:hypothetical protein
VGVVAALLAFTIVAACGRGGGGTTEQPDQPTNPDADAAPAFVEKNLQLQPDLTVVERKDKPVVKSIEGNGTGYLLDGSAPGVDKISEGKVLLVKNEVAGRVKKIERAGGDVRVTLEGVPLGELVKEGEITWNGLEPGKSKTQAFRYDDPNAINPGGEDDDESGVQQNSGPASGAIGGAIQAQPAGYRLNTPPPQTTLSQQFTIGTLLVTVEYKPTPKGYEATLEVTEKVPGVEWGGQFILKMNKISTNGRLAFSEGKPDGAAFQFNYAGAVEMKWVAGKETPGTFAYNNVVNIPIDFYQMFPTPSGIPLLLFVKMKILLQPGVSSGGTALQVKTQAAFNASGGSSGGTFDADLPAKAEAIKGVSLGVSGFVVAIRPRVGIGIGVGAMASAGPFIDGVVALGVTHASATGMVPDCRAMTLSAVVRYGYESNLLGFNTEFTKEFAPVKSKSTYTPKLNVCKPD